MAANQRRLAAIGNYQLSSITIGKGSFSKVMLANHIILNKNVALKVMSLCKIEDPYVKKNVQREASIMSRLHHPNVVALHEVCSTKDFFCLAMDFYSGGTLCDLVQDHPSGKLEEEQASIYFKQMVDGLSYIHSKDIIHRDMKLENIFLNKERTKVIIGDFGLSNFWHPGAKLETRCGSAEYAAPEIFDKNKDYTQAVDIWSLGILLYAMLSGQLPFEVEGGYNNIKELVDIIMVGLTKQNFNSLGKVSMEAKLMISQLLVVDQDLRIKIVDVSKQMWITQMEDMQVQEMPNTLTLEKQLEVANMVQAKLKLSHLTPNQILAYVLSAKGKLGKTAGCFSLMVKDLGTSSSQSMMTNVKQMMPQPSTSQTPPSAITMTRRPQPPPTVTPTSGENNLDRLVAKTPQQKPQSSFWSSTPGRKAMSALNTVQPKLDKDKENVPHDATDGEASAGKKVRRASSKSANNGWRRSVMPLPGQKRVGRLKRVDMEEEKMFLSKKEKKSVRIPLATRDENWGGGSKNY